MVGVLLGGIVGIAAGLAVNALWSRHTDRATERQLLDDIRDEAQGNLENLRAQGSEAARTAFVELYDTSAWDGAVATGKIGLVRDPKLARALGSAYTRLNASRKWEMVQVHFVVSGQFNQSKLNELTHTVVAARSTARDSLEGLVKAIDEWRENRG